MVALTVELMVNGPLGPRRRRRAGLGLSGIYTVAWSLLRWPLLLAIVVMLPRLPLPLQPERAATRWRDCVPGALRRRGAVDLAAVAFRISAAIGLSGSSGVAADDRASSSSASPSTRSSPPCSGPTWRASRSCSAASSTRSCGSAGRRAEAASAPSTAAAARAPAGRGAAMRRPHRAFDPTPRRATLQGCARPGGGSPAGLLAPARAGQRGDRRRALGGRRRGRGPRGTAGGARRARAAQRPARRLPRAGRAAAARAAAGARPARRLRPPDRLAPPQRDRVRGAAARATRC